MTVTQLTRFTAPMRLVTETLVASRDSWLCGTEIASASKLERPTVYGILARLHGLSWVDKEVEDGDPRKLGRPKKIFYRLTAYGVEQAEAKLARFTK
jgi:PadR family transcriptional regulator PadR